MKTLFATFALIVSLTPAAFAGRETGNGGDSCEDRIKIIRDDIQAWINNGGAEYLNLPALMSLSNYKANMLAKLDSAKIACTETILSVAGNEKTCINFKESDGTDRILCNFDRFNGTSESDQYVLVHHEFAGIAGLELTSQGSSYYEISNQITKSLSDQLVKKLAVKPPGNGVCPSTKVIGLYAGKFISEESQSDVFPVAIKIASAGIDRYGCASLIGSYDRPDLITNSGTMFLNITFDEQTNALTLRSYFSNDSPIPGHSYLVIKGQWAPTAFYARMQWWQHTGSLRLTRCESGGVNKFGECTK